MSFGYLAVKNDQNAQINNAECLSVSDMTQVKMALKCIMYLISMWENKYRFKKKCRNKENQLFILTHLQERFLCSLNSRDKEMKGLVYNQDKPVTEEEEMSLVYLFIFSR